ncbi:MAG: hypothetical protein SFY69_09345 [Planctomycetota bacterium]|nr:hypothetical protein [Planctomycetota bacterium]
MSELNVDRAMSRILQEAARARGVEVTALSEGWVLRLARGGVVRCVHGYAFDLNSAATHAIACDKAATSEVLGAAGLARVEHRLFLNPDLSAYVRHPGNWRGMLEFFEAHGRDVVVKDNTGTGGRDVQRARSHVALEAAALALFERGRSVALCPFVPIDAETRFVVLAGRCEVMYSKVRPAVVGDGVRTVLELLGDLVARGGLTRELSRLLATMDAETAGALRDRPAPGETRVVNWRHNLGQGASIELHAPDDEAFAEPRRLALSAAGTMNLTFGSVDVVRVGAAWRVLEVNSGVMMEALAGTPSGAGVARRVYERALDLMFDGAPAPTGSAGA